LSKPLRGFSSTAAGWAKNVVEIIKQNELREIRRRNPIIRAPVPDLFWGMLSL
jgi:hypothetical protein